ncbi:MAG: hypothetical protein KJP19_07860 [Deltaproteobacteria bacterium]|nr:hypothetical protein [Deltaproteobacteria bacterium]
MELKKCTECSEEKPLSEFYRRKGYKDGYTTECKACPKKKNKAYYQANREKILEKTKNYFQDNKERLAGKQRAYRKANKERLRARDKAYYLANRERILERERLYYQATHKRVKSVRVYMKNLGRHDCGFISARQ